jgi:RNA polymerase sigma-70 factor (ECF subfamily)
LEALSDAELVANYLAAGGGEDGSAWIQELFRRHYAKVVTWCLRVAGNREDACDLAQGIFMKVHRSIRSFRGDSKVSTWLYSITRSECMNFLKTRSRREESVEEDLDTEASDGAEPGPEETLDRLRSARLVRGLLDQTLDDTERDVFTLHFGDDLPLDAITRLLGLENRSGAKAYIVSARRKLARAVRRWRAGQEKLNA